MQVFIQQIILQLAEAISYGAKKLRLHLKLCSNEQISWLHGQLDIRKSNPTKKDCSVQTRMQHLTIRSLIGGQPCNDGSNRRTKECGACKRL